MTSRFLGGMLSDAEILGLKRETSESVDRVLSVLELEVTPQIKSALKLETRFFEPLYSYLGRQHLLGVAALRMALLKVRSAHTIDRFVVFENRFNAFPRAGATVQNHVRGILGPTALEIVCGDNKVYAWPGIRQALKRWRNLVRNLVCSSAGSKNAIFFYSPFERLGTILRSHLNDHHLVDLAIPAVVAPKPAPSIPLAFPSVDRFEGHPLDMILLEDIRADFCANQKMFFDFLRMLDSFKVRQMPAIGIWEIPPVCGTPALAFEYLRSKKIHVIGMQHGGIYGTAHYPWLIHSDFNRCDTFLTRGANKSDLLMTFPGQKMDCAVVAKKLPVKSIVARPRRSIDILFPMTNSLPMYDGGTSRLPADQITERQIQVLRYLDGLRGLQVYIKPVKNSTYQNCSVLPILDKCRNLKVVGDRTLSDFLETYIPRAAIVESFSSTLYDLLPHDVELFFVPDRLIPMEENAFRLLCQRVHVSENAQGLISLVELFLKGGLPPKRDGSFYDYFEKPLISESEFSEYLRGFSSRIAAESGFGKNPRSGCFTKDA